MNWGGFMGNFIQTVIGVCVVIIVITVMALVAGGDGSLYATSAQNCDKTHGKDNWVWISSREEIPWYIFGEVFKCVPDPCKWLGGSK